VVLLLLCSVASLVFWRAGIQTLHVVLLPVLILGSILVAFGPAAARAVLVPIGFLYFSMSAWNFLSGPLRALTLQVMGVVAPALGVPATVEGSFITFPNGAALEVTPECSGAGFLVQGLAVAVLLGELEQASLARRARLMASVIVVALVSNWVRVLVLLQVGYSTNMRHVLVARNHLWFGGVLYVIVLLVFVWLATRGSLPPSREARPQAAAAPKRWIGGYVTAMGALVVAPLAVYVLAANQQPAASAEALKLPDGHAGWRGPIPVEDEHWQPQFVGPHGQWHIAYEDSADRRIEMMAIGYAEQGQGRELVNAENSLLGPGLSPLTRVGVIADGQDYSETIVLDREGRRSVIWSVYDIGGRTFVMPMLSQLWYGLASLRTPPYSVLFAFRAQCVPSCTEARATLARFASSMGRELVASAAAGAVSAGAAGHTVAALSVSEARP
jgi:EpsI family protein